jgi:hypothetical protein
MRRIIEQFTGDFVLLDLGSANSAALFKPFPELAAAATVIRVDARSTAASSTHPFFRLINISKGISGKAGKRTFYSRKFPECSSFLLPKEELVKAYGMERYFEIDRELELDCATVPDVLTEHGIPRVDFFKTDLEGREFEVIKSSVGVVEEALFVQAELRFQPFYIGEPPFHEVSSYLGTLGFDLISLRPNVWKYNTPNRPYRRDGQTVWTDAFFILKPDHVRERFPESAWKMLTKQILLTHAVGLANVAEYLFLQAKAVMPGDIQKEIELLFRRENHWPLALFAASTKSRFGQILFGGSRRAFAKGYSICSVFKDEVIGITSPF